MSVNRETLQHLYSHDNLLQKQIARKLGCSQSWVCKLMKKHGVKARSRSEAKIGRSIHGGSRDCPWISKLNKKRWKDPEYRAKMSKNLIQKGDEPWNKGLPSEQQPRYGKGNIVICKVCGKKFHAPPSRNRIYCSQACLGIDYKTRMKGRKGTWGKKLSLYQKTHSVFFKLNKDSEFQKKRMKALHARPNKPEKKIIEILNRNKLPFKYVGDGEVIIGYVCPDFIHSNGEKKVIELFGRNFHDPNKSPYEIAWHRQYWGRKAYFSQLGYDCLILWDDEIDDENKVVRKIEGF